MISWIASYPKSGSTWVRLLLNAYWFGECDINNLMSCTGDLKPVYYQNVSPKSVDKLEPAEIVCLRPAALMQIIETWPFQPVMVKTHFANLYFDEMPIIPFRMTKRAFYIVRDPRDVALSYANHFGCSIDEAIESMADDTKSIGDKDSNFKHVLTSWSGHVDSWLADKSYPVHLIRYEALQKRPGDVIANILDKMGLEPDPKRIERAIELTEFSKMKAQEEEKGFREAPKERTFFRQGKIGEWKDKLTPLQVSRINLAHSATMKRLGYV